MTKPDRTESYHHGDLKAGLIEAATHILEEEGVGALTLRAIARRAGVSHAAPKNHFENLTALLSELAAIGFERFADQLTTAVSKATRPTERNRLSGLAYVTFARENPAMFELMFRSDKPDFANPRLQTSSERALRGLAANNDVAFKNGELTALTADQGARMARTWALAHGLAMLMLDDQLTPILQRLPNDYEPDELFQTIFRISNV